MARRRPGRPDAESGHDEGRLDLSDDLKECWPIWRIATSEALRGQQVSDIMTNWTLDDLADANEVLDAIEEAQARVMRAAERKR